MSRSSLVVEEIHSAPMEAAPGAVAVGDLGLALGLTTGGFALCSNGSLGFGGRRTVPDLFDGPCVGIQVSGTGVILLGDGQPSGSGEPPARSLLYLPLHTDTHIPPFRIPLGRGSWTLVRGSRSDSVMVYDRSSHERGARAIRASTGEILWESAEGLRLRRVRWAGPRALGLTEDGDMVSIETKTGKVDGHRTLPPAPDGGRWTAWTGSGLDDLLLGGAGCSCFFVGRLAGKDVRDIAALPAGSAFGEAPPLPLAVAAIEALEDGRCLLILGGDGETSARDASPCVAAVVSGPDEWSTVQLDPENACSAVVGYDGGWLVQCGHRLRLVRLA